MRVALYICPQRALVYIIYIFTATTNIEPSHASFQLSIFKYLFSNKYVSNRLKLVFFKLEIADEIIDFYNITGK